MKVGINNEKNLRKYTTCSPNNQPIEKNSERKLENFLREMTNRNIDYLSCTQDAPQGAITTTQACIQDREIFQINNLKFQLKE